MLKERKKGALLAYVSIALKLCIAFVFTPFLITTLGKSEYGIYSIIGSIVAYLAILDFGINDSTVRYLVRQRKLGLSEEGRAIIDSIGLLYSIIGFLVLITGIVTYLNLDLLLLGSFTKYEADLLKIIFMVAMLNVTVTMAMNPVTAALMAYEKFVFLKTIEIISYMVTTLAIVVFLIAGYNVIAVVVISAIVNMLSVVIKYLYLRLKIGITFGLKKYSSSYVKELFQYAAPIFIVVIVEQIYWKLDNVLIGAFLGPSIVATYAVGIFFHKHLLSFSTAISRVMIPKMIANVDANRSGEELTRILIGISRYQLMIVLLMISGLVCFGREFIILWVGENFEIAYSVMIYALIPFSIEIIGNVRNVIMQVKKLYWYRSVLIFIISSLNIVATYILIQKYGIVAASACTGAGIVLGYAGLHAILHWKVGINCTQFFLQVWLRALPVLIGCALLAFMLNQTALSGWQGLIVKIILFTLLYISLMWWMYLKQEERSVFKSLISRVLLS